MFLIIVVLSPVAVLCAAPVKAVIVRQDQSALFSRFRVADNPSVPKGAKRLALLNPSVQIDFGVALRIRQPRLLGELAASISTPGSPDFHRYIKPPQFAADFAPTLSAIASVERSLRAVGLKPGRLARNHLLLDVHGTVAQIQRELHTRLMSYRIAKGILGWATSSPPSLPSSFARTVSGVIGLDNLAIPRSFLVRAPPGSTTPKGRSLHLSRALGPVAPGAPSACGAALTAALSGSGWTEDQLASAYGLSGLMASGDLGAGQTIAVYELEPFLTNDVAGFDKCYFGTDHSSQIQTIPVDGFNLVGSGSGEAILDVEELSALAPKANLLVYEAPNTAFGSIDEYNSIIASDQANLITTSWGECESALQASVPGARILENYLFEEAAAQGQTVVAASGDTGSDDCAGTPFSSTKAVAPYLSVDDPASQPYVLAVGGTSLTSDLSPLTNSNETVWNDGVRFGGTGGGVSSFWASPAWQAGSGIPGILPMRNRQIPDVSLSADELHGVSVYSPSLAGSGPIAPSGSSPQDASGVLGWTTIGGTSAAAPVLTAILADVAASGTINAGCAALPVKSGGADLGFIPPELYEVAATQYATSFHDLTSGNNDVFHLGNGYLAGAGYDLASGLGSPIVTNANGQSGLASGLCAVAAGSSTGQPPVPIVTSLAPSSGPSSGGNTVTINLSAPIAPGATVTVAFGSLPAPVLSAQASAVVVTVPPSPIPPGVSGIIGAGPALITVVETTPAGSSASRGGPGSIYQYVALANINNQSPPAVTGIGPSGGRGSGGNLVTIYGAGFGAGTSVTFGGVASPEVHVTSNFELNAVVPPELARTHCTIGTVVQNSTCQVQVVVANNFGESAQAPILHSLSGKLSWTPQGILAPRPGREVAPALTEYDYAPRPRIISVSFTPPTLAHVAALSIIGSGFNVNTFEWVNFGSANSPQSEQVQIRYLSPTRISIDAAQDRNASGVGSSISVQTLAGLSNIIVSGHESAVSVTKLSSLGGPVSGGTQLVLSGRGLAAVNSVILRSEEPGIPDTAVRGAGLNHRANGSVVLRTPAHGAGLVDVIACTTRACEAAAPRLDTFVYYNTTGVAIDQVEPNTGPAAGASTLTVFGNGLNSAVALQFGRQTVAVTSSSSYPTNDPFLRTVLSAPGPAATSVAMKLSFQHGVMRAAGTFRYLASGPSAPTGVVVSMSPGVTTLRWALPLSDGGSPIIAYTVDAVPETGSAKQITLRATSRFFSFQGLLRGASYVFRVSARNAAHGQGLWAQAAARSLAS